ncbi:MAG: DegT/DnrJ/EryC1/StrS family aminotransferase, partial [Bacilli bacterium]
LHIADQYNLYVIEDACEAIGAMWRGKPVGTIGDVGVFAFYPNKQITTGEGGMLITNDHSIFLKASSLRNQGRSVNSDWLQHDIIGYNYRMSDIQAAVGLAQMEKLDVILNKRKEVASKYDDLIKQFQVPVTTPFIHPDCKMSWFVYVVVLPVGTNRIQLMNNIQSQGIQSKPYFPTIHLQNIYRELYSFKIGDFPMCEKMSERTLAIPFYTELSSEQQRYVIQHLANELKRNDVD